MALMDGRSFRYVGRIVLAVSVSLLVGGLCARLLSAPPVVVFVVCLAATHLTWTLSEPLQ